MDLYTQPHRSSFGHMNEESKCNKPINLFYSCTSTSSTPNVQVHTTPDCSGVFLTTSTEQSSESRSDGPSSGGMETESEEDGDCDPYGDLRSKRVKTSDQSTKNINLLSEQANQRRCSQTDANGSHSTATLQKSSSNRDRTLRGSFDEESECSTACETHSDGTTTLEASEFSPFMSFVPAKGHRMEEMRLDDDFCLDSSTCSDDDVSYLKEGIEIATSYEGTCERKCNRGARKNVLKFTCKLKHTFDHTIEGARERWCPRCHLSLKNMQEYAAANNGRVVNRYYDEKITFECEHNHVWTISNKSAKKRWCSQCLKDNKKNIKVQLEEERKKREMEAEEIQRQLFENARRQSNHSTKATNSTKSSQSVGSQASLIQYLQKAEAEIEKSAKQKTSDFMASQEFQDNCTQDQILQVYKIIVMPEDILQLYMFNLSLECLRAEYKRLAKVIHPDKNKHPEAGNAFQRIHRMYESALGKLNASC
eukprot:CAMPEP_0176457834 /NCGR_PEP_ID=MMETSP0127-20121128/32206_1 /TAXON_ID=938130 /ORGANISM="Platyophrya macrostoma, Strain WH" /LENGTH=478 /DNA_ID=CAMNT_0017848233 /DNA_START=87 /DNA_END=1523 /DNA_ORIENTATION=+